MRDSVSRELHARIVRREGACLAYRLDSSHICKDTWNRSHSPYALEKLTVDHVHDAATMGKRAPSDERHLVALCHWANVHGWASAHRNEERGYLSVVAP